MATGLTGDVRVERDGGLTRIFVYPARTPRRIVVAVLLAIFGVGFAGYGIYYAANAYGDTGLLEFDALALAIAGVTMACVAYMFWPKTGRWSHQFIYDGESVYCIDSRGTGTGLREDIGSLKVRGDGDHAVLMGSHGVLGHRLARHAAELVLAVLEAAGPDALVPENLQSRTLTQLGSGETAVTSVLPRPGIDGVSQARRAFWPIALLLLGLPTALIALSLMSFSWDGPGATFYSLLGLGLFGYALVIPFIGYLRRQRVRRSAPMVPHSITYTDELVSIADGSVSRADRRVSEFPFESLRNVELLDPDDDDVSRLEGVNGVPASGLVIVHASRDAVVRGALMRTVVLRGVHHTDALHIRDDILEARDEWRVRHPLSSADIIGVGHT